MENLPTPSDDGSARRRRITAIVAAAVFLAATIYYAWDLRSREVEVMESQDLGIAHEMYANGDPNLPTDQSPVYYVFLHFWERLSRSSYAFLRFPSAVFGGCAVLCVFLLAAGEAGLTAGLLAALLMTLSPLVIYFARTARMYAVVIAAASACLLFAHRYVVRTRKTWDLFWCLAFAVLGIYSHLFGLLLAGSVGLLVLLVAVRRLKLLVRAAIPAVVAIGAIVPQLLRIANVIRHTQGRSALYGGVAHQWGPFFRSLAKDFFLGYGNPPLRFPWAVGVAVGLLVVGILGLRGRGLLAALVLFAPGLAVGWHLSATAPFETRYLVYLIPAVAAFGGIGLAKLRRFWIWAPLATVAVAFQYAAVKGEYEPPPIDWKEAGAFIDQVKQPGDVVAVFPDYWRNTFQRFWPSGETVPFTRVEELDRIQARGRRVIVVRGPGNYRENVENYINKHAAVGQRFRTKVRDRLAVYVLDARPPVKPDLAATDDPSVLVTGIVGSGGYPWQEGGDAENPFARLAGVFRSADLVVAEYHPYAAFEQTTLQKIYLQRNLGPREPNVSVARFLADAGVRAALPVPPDKGAPDGTFVLNQGGIEAVAAGKTWSDARPWVRTLKGVNVAFLYSGQRISAGDPRSPVKGNATLAEFEKAVRGAREAAGPTGRLVVFLPHPVNNDRFARADDQVLARRAIGLGADAVIGVGGGAAAALEEYRGGIIAYSLGTLLRPPFLRGGLLGSLGTLLRLSFPREGKPRWEIVPVTFDDAFRPAFSPPERFAALRPEDPDDPAAEHLAGRLIHARVVVTDPSGANRDATRWTGDVSVGDSLGEGYTDGAAHVSTAMSISTGVHRRGIELAPRGVKKIAVTFPQVVLGEKLRIVYGLADSTIIAARKPAQRLNVAANGKTLLNKTVQNLTDWNTADVDTKPLAGTAQDLTITVEGSKKTDFAVVVDPIVLRGPETVKLLARAPYHFADHFEEARVSAVKPDAAETCWGPDEAYRWLAGEENGKYAEGVLYKRWICGDLPWNATALTVQKSGGDLRPAIWHHPLNGADKLLAYGPLKVRSTIRGFVGFTDLAAPKKDVPIDFTILVGGREVYRQSVPSTRGWKPFAVDLPADLRGKEAEITFRVRAAADKWRHFCFDAWME